MYVPDQAVAEDVVQETWLGVLQGIHRFQERSSLKTWIFSILTNRAKTRGQRESRTIPFSALGSEDTEPEERAVEADRFNSSVHQWPGHWVPVTRPQRWDNIPEEQLVSQETQAKLKAAIEALPPHQREVITLRDVHGWTSEEVCNALALTETNQRVLLHRARAKVRRALENYLNAA
jgi:RNA polymerase sigma-70 factor (ECF subfamily)